MTVEKVLDADEYFERGNKYYEEGDYDKAIENYSMAIVLKPDFLECYFNRALCYWIQIIQ
ncbi:MAG: tetratricopeptide repeat protein [Candidatus Micrarchaeia archaeon]